MRTAIRLGVALAAASLIPLMGISSASAVEPTTTTTTTTPPPPKPPALSIKVSPNPLILTAQSEVHAVVEVEAHPNLSSSGPIDISSTQLAADCAAVFWHSVAFGLGSISYPGVAGPGIGLDYGHPIWLDNDGNATVKVDAYGCQAGSDLFAVSLTGPPYTTATTTLHVKAPVTTEPGVIGYPQTTKLANGNVVRGEVETGDTIGLSGDSDVYAMFMVEVPSYYAGRTVQIQANELFSRCLGGSFWDSNSNPGTGTAWTAKVDNNGNAAFDFYGIGCAAGTSKVIVHVLAGTHPTYTTTFTIHSPQPTW